MLADAVTSYGAGGPNIFLVGTKRPPKAILFYARTNQRNFWLAPKVSGLGDDTGRVECSCVLRACIAWWSADSKGNRQTLQGRVYAHLRSA